MEEFLTDKNLIISIGIALNFILIFILFMMSISNKMNFKKFRTKYNKMMVGAGDISIEQLLEKCIDKVSEIEIKNKGIENEINKIERNLIECYQKIGVIRYNAFDNVGSDLSFSIAILDNNDNGLVLSGIYSRDSSSTYAKPVLGGKSKYSLSAEEIQALEVAKKSFRDKPF